MEIKYTEPTIYIFAGKARHGKDTCAAIVNELKDETINLNFAYTLKDYAKRISNWDGSDETKPRELLQQLGTNIIRKNIDEMFFVKRMIEDIKVFGYFFKYITISDARFKNEIDSIRKNFKKVVVVRVNRPNFDNGLTLEQKNHPTEIDLDDYNNYDYIVENDSTIEELKEKINKIVSEVDNKWI
ncbi:MAG: hypothetical protein IJ134_02740 [Bacilli bacterium]|nr:hypothetical protein [Bacilli bacterium]